MKWGLGKGKALRGVKASLSTTLEMLQNTTFKIQLRPKYNFQNTAETKIQLSRYSWDKNTTVQNTAATKIQPSIDLLFRWFFEHQMGPFFWQFILTSDGKNFDAKASLLLVMLQPWTVSSFHFSLSDSTISTPANHVTVVSPRKRASSQCHHRLPPLSSV